ncbi:MAG: hypothetical protein CL608_30145 [Anaerolineaceae bacterium]|nr:hypothetical protein [Anaerolineaceae bacterium]
MKINRLSILSLLILLAGLFLIGCSPGGGEPAIATVTPLNTPVAVVNTPTVESDPVQETVTPEETAVPQETTTPAETATAPAQPTATTAAPTQPVIIVPTDVERVMALTNLNVRSGPGLGFAVVDWLTGGETAVVTGVSEDGGWWRILCPVAMPGISCYVSAAGEYTQPMMPDGAQPERIQFAPGATSATVEVQIPAHAQTWFVLWAAAEQTMSINVAAENNSVLFHLQGKEDGVDYKHMLDGNSFWQGKLPVSQDYILTLDNGSSATSVIIDISIVNNPPTDTPGGPLHPIVDGATGFLLGGWYNNAWVSAADYMALISDAERPYVFYGLSGETGVITGQPPTIGGICNQPTVALASLMPGSIGLVGRWNATPRLPQDVPVNTDVYRQVLAEALQGAGLAEPEITIDRILRFDLEGDGVEEVLIVANHLTAGIGQPPAAAGDYAVVLLRKIIGSDVVTVPLYLDIYQEGGDLIFPLRYEALAVADLNGDGRLEIVIAADRYEGRQVAVIESYGATSQVMLQAGCNQ